MTQRQRPTRALTCPGCGWSRKSPANGYTITCQGCGHRHYVPRWTPAADTLAARTPVRVECGCGCEWQTRAKSQSAIRCPDCRRSVWVPVRAELAPAPPPTPPPPARRTPPAPPGTARPHHPHRPAPARTAPVRPAIPAPTPGALGAVLGRLAAGWLTPRTAPPAVPPAPRPAPSAPTPVPRPPRLTRPAPPATYPGTPTVRAAADPGPATPYGADRRVTPGSPERVPAGSPYAVGPNTPTTLARAYRFQLVPEAGTGITIGKCPILDSRTGARCVAPALHIVRMSPNDYLPICDRHGRAVIATAQENGYRVSVERIG
jgi:hypothetical protein